MDSAGFNGKFGLEELNFIQAGFDDDNSDDERCPLEGKYNDCGKFIKACLKKSESQGISFYGNKPTPSSWKSNVSNESTKNSNQEDKNQKQNQLTVQAKEVTKLTVFKKSGLPEDSFEPIFGLRLM